MAGKIEALFSLRKLPWLISLSGASATDQEQFLQQLVQLQYRIYLLDKYLEHNWFPEQSVLQQLWDDCHSRLMEFGYSHEQVAKLLKSFRIYLQRELVIRKGKTPDQLSIRTFYWHKSCDVKLIRHLIYDRFPEIAPIFPRSSWIAFDYLTEIVDDLEDLQEDLDVYNGNRLLFALQKQELTYVRTEYLRFLEWIRQRSYPDRNRWPEWLQAEFDQHQTWLYAELSQVSLPISH